MAASMWRMNGLWRRMAGLLVLCALLLSNEVMCQDDTAPDATDAPATDPAAAVSDAADSAAAPAATDAPDGVAAATVAAGEESATSAAPADISLGVTIVNIAINPDNQEGDATGTSGTTAVPVVPVVRHDVTVRTNVPDNSKIVKLVPQVKCVGQDDIPESNVKAEVATADCETTKNIILENPAGWCATQQCELKISQSDKTMMVASDNSDLNTLAKVLQSEPLKEKLGVTKTETPSSSSSSVFVGILVSGLLAALAITVGYFKCQRRSDTKGVRLAEEAYPVDQENQGNTLVSVAPLNPLQKPRRNPA